MEHLFLRELVLNLADWSGMAERPFLGLTSFGMAALDGVAPARPRRATGRQFLRELVSTTAGLLETAKTLFRALTSAAVGLPQTSVPQFLLEPVSTLTGLPRTVEHPFLYEWILG